MRYLILFAAFLTQLAIAEAPCAEPLKNYPKYVEECREPALKKLRSLVEFNKLELDETSFKVALIDDRWYNPSKYVWFSADVKAANGEVSSVQVLTQKSFFPRQDCF